MIIRASRTWYAPLLLILYAAVAGVMAPQFLSLQNISGLLFSACLLLPATAGMQILLIVGRFDLSSGSVASLAGILVAIAFSVGVQWPGAVALGLAAGLAAGLVTGFLVAILQLDALIATLAVMGIARSLALALPNGQTVSVLYGPFEGLARGTWMGIDKVVWYGLICVILIEALMRLHVGMRRLYAVGSNARAATVAGLHTEKLTMLAFAIAGVGAAITGLLQASRAMAASPLVFQDLALDTIGACIIGGASLRGGRGTIAGAACGLLAVVSTRNLVVMLDISVYWRYAFIGGLLLLAATADSVGRGTSASKNL